jgi:hypothetical protein
VFFVCSLSGLCGEEALVRAPALALLRSFRIIFVSCPNPRGGSLQSPAVVRMMFLRCSHLPLSSVMTCVATRCAGAVRVSRVS